MTIRESGPDQLGRRGDSPTAGPRCPFSDPRAVFSDLAEARARPKLTWSETLRRHVLSRYDDIVEALHHPEVYSSSIVVPEIPPEWRAKFAGVVGERSLPIHLERFAPKPLLAGKNAAFEVMLAATGQTVTVASWESVLDAVNRAGASVPSTCREGTCGTCEVRVLSGTPDHRDSVLTPQEHAANEYMMTCVSRSLGPSLVLDL